MTQVYCPITIEAAAKVVEEWRYAGTVDGLNRTDIAAAIRALPVSPVPTPSDAIGETVEKLREALAALEASASQVSRYGAQTGPQWPTLTAALIKARAALATPLPMKED